VRLPDIEEIAHDQHDIAPAFGILSPAFAFKVKSSPIKWSFFFVFPLSVNGLAGENLGNFGEQSLVMIDSGDIHIPNTETLQNLCCQHFKLGFQNSTFGMNRGLIGVDEKRDGLWNTYKPTPAGQRIVSQLLA